MHCSLSRGHGCKTWLVYLFTPYLFTPYVSYIANITRALCINLLVLCLNYVVQLDHSLELFVKLSITLFK